MIRNRPKAAVAPLVAESEASDYCFESIMTSQENARAHGALHQHFRLQNGHVTSARRWFFLDFRFRLRRLFLRRLFLRFLSFFDSGEIRKMLKLMTMGYHIKCL